MFSNEFKIVVKGFNDLVRFYKKYPKQSLLALLTGLFLGWLFSLGFIFF